MHSRKECKHGFANSRCRCLGPHEIILVPCSTVQACPTNDPVEPVKAPLTGATLSLVSEPTLSLTGLTVADLEALQAALSFTDNESRYPGEMGERIRHFEIMISETLNTL